MHMHFFVLSLELFDFIHLSPFLFPSSTHPPPSILPHLSSPLFSPSTHLTARFALNYPILPRRPSLSFSLFPFLSFLSLSLSISSIFDHHPSRILRRHFLLFLPTLPRRFSTLPVFLPFCFVDTGLHRLAPIGTRLNHTVKELVGLADWVAHHFGLALALGSAILSLPRLFVGQGLVLGDPADLLSHVPHPVTSILRSLVSNFSSPVFFLRHSLFLRYSWERNTRAQASKCALSFTLSRLDIHTAN